ncbi:hypothetical protein [Hymenobacter aerophilus]|uniref:hypothetical protein n=1 Tax=Hymenobacter aerophilus TaxID=119644 RepID=UPI0012F77E0E|nr:hypothetical protein [Hymenobacter aerophilus]
MKKHFLLLFLLTGNFVSCIVVDDRLRVINKTNASIVVETYQDTVPNYANTNNKEYYLERCIAPNDSTRLFRPTKEGWPQFVEHANQKQLNLVMYSCDTLEKYSSIDTLIIRKIYRRKQINYSVLKGKKQWRIVIE